MSRVEDAIALYDRGLWLLPVKQKRPFFKDWTKLERSTREQVASWAVVHDIGIRTGHVVTVLDIDKGAAPEWFDITRYGQTPIVRTASGGLHVYYAACDLHNSASKLAPKVDVRGIGGHVVMYPDWIVPWCTPLPFPADWLAILRAPKRKPPSNKWAETALAAEITAVSLATEGTRNDQLNRSAFSLGQIVAGGALTESQVRAGLESAALSVGLDAREIASTLDSGLRAGAQTPRRAPETPNIIAVVEAEHRPSEIGKRRILCPGSHTFADGSVQRVSLTDFADAALALIGQHHLYRRATIVGYVEDSQFIPASTTLVRLLVDAAGDIEHHSVVRDIAEVKYLQCTDDLAAVILEHARKHPNVLPLTAICPHPVICADGSVLGNGYHDGVLVTDDCSDATPIDPDTLLVDFPLDEIGRANWNALILTVMARPRVKGDVPVWLFSAPQPGSGKSFLALKMPGLITHGRDFGSTQWPKDESEVSKKLLALAISGAPVLGLDNVHGTLDSGALASFITSRWVSDRILGRSETVTLPNLCTVVANGNNLTVSGEMARRGCTVELTPRRDQTQRTDWKHQDILDATLAARRGILRHNALLALAWKKAGCPKAPETTMGGFEQWVAVVPAILAHAGRQVLGDEQFRRAANEEIIETERFVAAWEELLGLRTPVTAADLVALAERQEVLLDRLGAGNTQSRIIRMGFILRSLSKRRIGGCSIVRAGERKDRHFLLVREGMLGDV